MREGTRIGENARVVIGHDVHQSFLKRLVVLEASRVGRVCLSSKVCASSEGVVPFLDPQ